jgi:glycosyltransferase involved in cell wall biosynthesis
VEPGTKTDLARSKTGNAEGRGSVLIVGNFLSGTVGNRGVCEELADRLRASGWKVIATSSRTGRFQRLADMLWTVWRRRREFQVVQIDLFSGPAFFWAAAVSVLLHALGKPYVLTLHGGNLPAFSSRWPWATRVLLQSAATVTAPSGYLVEAMRRFRPDLRLLPNAIDLSLYPFRLRKSARPRLVWLRAFHRIYDPSLAVRVLSLLAPEFPDVHLLMVGPDKGDDSLRAALSLAAASGVKDRIEYPGRVAKSEVADWINRGDIFLNTSTVDNNPVTILEAMACGACVVSTLAGGIPYLASNGVDSMLTEPGDANGMAECVAKLLRNPELAASLSLNARRRVEAIDWSNVLPEWQALLLSASQQTPLRTREKLRKAVS